MASLQRQPSHPRSTPTRMNESADSQSQAQQQQSDPQPGAKESDASTDHEQPQTNSSQQEQASPTPMPRFTSADDDPSVKKCWICFSDSTEDTPETSAWRDPCPCALVAHEACLLDWIADTEIHKNTTRGGIIGAPQILCPQCKGEIRLARPRSYVVDLFRFFDRSLSRLVMPGGVILLSFNVISRLSVYHAIHSLYRVFGAADAQRILRPLFERVALSPADLTLTRAEIIGKVIEQTITLYARNWRLYLGLPLITPLLLLSRTNWHISEAILTITPTVFFALQSRQPDEMFQFGQWPPSASMAFAMLPYARHAYNQYYERVWGERIRGWNKEILPSTSQPQTDLAAEHDPLQAIENAADGENVFEIRVDTGIWEEWEEEMPALGEPEAENPGPAQNAVADVADPQVAGAANEDDEAAPAPVVQDNRRRANAVQALPQEAGVERRLSFSPVQMAASVLGALAFPTIAELSGEILLLALPTSWTFKPSNPFSLLGAIGVHPRPTGLLQQKWGRSLIGGCLFVVLKDALMIYVRWKRAQIHRNRHILDYDRSKSRAKS